MIAALLPVIVPVSAQAQSSRDVPPLTSVVDADALQDLPSTESLFSTLETTQAPVISDRFSAGLNPAEPARLGAFLNSWTQTTYRIGDVDITSPQGGVPMFVPQVPLWKSVAVTSGLVPADATGPGVLVSLDPRGPSASWSANAIVAGSRGPLVASAASVAPAIARPDAWSHADVTISGPLVRDRAALLVSASTTRSSQFEQGNPVAADAAIDSLFSNLIVTRGNSEVRTVGWLQKARSPLSHDLPYVHDECGETRYIAASADDMGAPPCVSRAMAGLRIGDATCPRCGDDIAAVTDSRAAFRRPRIRPRQRRRGTRATMDHGFPRG